MAKCYGGDNPIDPDDRVVIWKWAKTEGGIDAGATIDQVHDAINQKFYGGKAKPEWVNDILSGRKTPFRQQATDVWKKQYNRRVITQQAGDISRMAAYGPIGKVIRGIWTLPRSIAVAGHGIVFPFTHAGDLIARPTSWGTFIKGALRTYRAAPEFWGVGSKLGGGKAYTERVLNNMSRATFEDSFGLKGDRRSAYDLGIRSGVDMGPKSFPSGLINRYYHGPADRAWKMLTVMRFELWKKAMSKYVKPGMDEATMLDLGQNLATWANHATGSGKGIVAKAGGALFGPKLTQSKINRISIDPLQTIKTFADWKNATPGQRAVAWERLSGSAQFLATNLGFLAANAGLLYALGSKQKINTTDPTKSDWMAFKGLGVLGYVPGLHTELRTLGRIFVTALQGTAAGKRLAKLNPGLAYLAKEPYEGKVATTYDVAKEYATAKLTPSITRPVEAAMAEDYRGRPLPWSNQAYGLNRYGKPDKSKPRYTWGEYAGSIGPIPLEGPIAYAYDQMKKAGAKPTDAVGLIKAMIYYGATPEGALIAGLGGIGTHVREEYKPKPKPHY